jgi:hypothetical protein
MASVVDICNAALTHVANAAEVTSIDPPDGTAEADHCARFYPMARDECLEQYAWSFAIARKYLAEFAENLMGDTWGFAYQLPNHMLTPLAVLEPGAANDVESRSYLIETLPDGEGVLYTNVDGAVLKYLYRQEDTAKFTPLFTVAVATVLGSYLAGAIPKDIKLKQGLKQQGYAELAVAATRNKAQKIDIYKYFTPAHLAARA